MLVPSGIATGRVRKMSTAKFLSSCLRTAVVVVMREWAIMVTSSLSLYFCLAASQFNRAWHHSLRLPQSKSSILLGKPRERAMEASQWRVDGIYILQAALPQQSHKYSYMIFSFILTFQLKLRSHLVL
ncbi:hypothetical protein BDW74DRAFT_999 [Aspergillus multicolor]|uniref:uncharacterized protein n=1 Tax=Aspergillus multicolor TaxID=41759 RepID=UPI003CCD1BED